MEDALALPKRTRDNFYISAFKTECWLGKLADATAAEYAENKSAADRNLQTGEARRFFGHVFNETPDHDFLTLFKHLIRFAGDEEPYGQVLGQGCCALYREAQFPPGANQLSSRGAIRVDAQSARRLVDRLCDWLDAIAHWRIHERYYLSPVSFQADPDKRELAGIGWQQRYFSKLSPVSKAYWEWHHSVAAERFANSDKWAMVGQAMSAQDTRYHPYLPLDQLVILFWPLVKRYSWTYRDLLNVIRAIPKQGTRYPCRKEQELAAYCNNVLGLRKQTAGRSSRNGKPEGWQVAMSFLS
jgi:hypothetical protein